MDFTSLPKLPLLPALNLNGVSSDAITNAINSHNDAVQAGNSAVNDLTKKVADSFLGGISFTNIITVLVGLILILAGVLSFKPAREVAVTAAKTAAL